MSARHLSAAGVYLLANVCGRLQFFVTLPVVSRHITPAEYGLLTLANLAAVVVSTTVQAGVTGAVERFYADFTGRERARYLGDIYGYLLLACGAIAALAMTAGPSLARVALAQPVPFFPVVALPIGTALIGALGTFALALFRIEERPGAVLATGLTRLVAGTLAVVVVVQVMDGGLVGYLAALLLVELVVVLGAVPYVLRRIAIGLDSRRLRRVFDYSGPLVPYVVLAVVRDVGDRWLLQHRVTLAELGIYGLGWGVASGVNMVVSSVSVPYAATMMRRFGGMPRTEAWAGHLAALRPLATDAIVLTLAAYGGLLLLAQDFVRVFAAPAYHDAWRIACWFGGVFVLRALYLLPHNALHWMRRTPAVPWATAAGLLAGAPIVWYGVPYLGVAAGAAGAGACYVVSWLATRRALPSWAWLFPASPAAVLGATLAVGAAAGVVIATMGEDPAVRMGARGAAGLAGVAALLAWGLRRQARPGAAEVAGLTVEAGRERSE